MCSSSATTSAPGGAPASGAGDLLTALRAVPDPRPGGAHRQPHRVRARVEQYAATTPRAPETGQIPAATEPCWPPRLTAPQALKHTTHHHPPTTYLHPPDRYDPIPPAGIQRNVTLPGVVPVLRTVTLLRPL